MLRKIRVFWLVMLVSSARADLTEAHIKSDSGNFNYKIGELVYLGHVVATEPGYQLEAEKLINYLDKQHKLNKAVAFGNPAHLWQAATKQQSEFNAYAKRIEFYPKEHLLILIGDGKLVSEENVLQAPHMVYHTQEQRLVTKQVGSQGTSIIFTHKQ